MVRRIEIYPKKQLHKEPSKQFFQVDFVVKKPYSCTEKGEFCLTSKMTYGEIDRHVDELIKQIKAAGESAKELLKQQ